jgi:CRP/FNR family cyclic AMP-dependent transcriptional regulator
VALRKNAKIELLKRVPLFSGCSKKELAEIAMVADEIDLREGTTLIREGRRGDEFFVIVDGTVMVTRRGRTVNELGAGSWVGEIALISDLPRTATVVATSPLRVLVVTPRAFQRLMRGSPSIAIKLLQSVAERLEPESA